MTLNEYQQASRETAVYNDIGKNFIYPTLGLASEAGEVAGKVKRIARDHGGEITDQVREGIHNELGDVLWYVAQLATELNMTLDEIAASNIAKLASRKDRGVLHGSGDQR